MPVSSNLLNGPSLFNELPCSCEALMNSRLMGHPAPRVAAGKELYLAHCGVCRGFFVKFLAAIFLEIRERKSAKIFAALFASLLQKIRHNFALWDYGYNSGLMGLIAMGWKRFPRGSSTIPPVRLALSGRNSGKTPERPRKCSQSVSWNFPPRVWLGSPKTL